jgi:mono/diheme cytochrome c family protein
MNRIGWVCLLGLLGGCATANPPNVSPQMVAATSGRPVTVAQLQHGRSLFASRCIECHTLPAVTEHPASEWPHLIDEMAGRANLKPVEREELLAYVLAAQRVQSNPN